MERNNITGHIENHDFRWFDGSRSHWLWESRACHTANWPERSKHVVDSRRMAYGGDPHESTVSLSSCCLLALNPTHKQKHSNLENGRKRKNKLRKWNHISTQHCSFTWITALPMPWSRCFSRTKYVRRTCSYQSSLCSNVEENAQTTCGQTSPLKYR